MKEKKSKSKIFIWFMILYVCIWLSATAVVNGWVWDKAQGYQNEYDTAKAGAHPEIFMDEFVKTIDASVLAEWLGSNGDYNISDYTAEDEYINYFSQVIGDDEIYYEVTDKKNIYNICTDGEIIASVQIGSNNQFDKFNFSGWKFLDADVLSYMYETFSKTIHVDKSFDVYVNGKQLTDEYIIMEKTTTMGEYVSAITGEEYGTNIYKIEGFLVEPDISVVDKNGNKVENTSVEIDLAEYINHDDSQIDSDKRQRVIDTFYAYFNHMNKLLGYEEMKAYLVQGTEAYDVINSAQSSLEWVRTVREITVVEEVIDEYVQYNDTYFSCNVHWLLEKDYGYTQKSEYFDASVLFKKVNNVWYLDTFILN